jgi:hypothetical protein
MKTKMLIKMANTSSTSSASPAPFKVRVGPRYANHADWIPIYYAAMLTYRDARLRGCVQTEVKRMAADIIDEAYYSRLVRVVRSKLPRGIVFPDGNWEDTSPGIDGIPYLRMTRAALVKVGEDAADRVIPVAVISATEGWVVCNRVMLNLRFKWRDVEPMLTAALNELNDADAASNCVLAWVRFPIQGQPPNWRMVHELVMTHPHLLTIGGQKMIDRGWVPPPWVTVAIA